ncbi:hypothetical protein ELH82_24590 [Rhizobium leguminosarum]|nr:hypothetical protein ELH82_24590 [Rhizobium leguminosarum]
MLLKRNPKSLICHLSLEHDAEKCERFSDDIMLYFFDLDPDSDFRPIRPKIILIYQLLPRFSTTRQSGRPRSNGHACTSRSLK